MTFNLNTRTRRIVGALLATAVIGGGATGAVVAAGDGAARAPTSAQGAAPHTVSVAASSSVPRGVVAAESAAEDVIGYLEQGKIAKSSTAARALKTLAHGEAARALRKAGTPAPQVAAFQQRADRTARLSSSSASPLRVSLAANSVSQLMPGFYSRYSDPVPPAVLKLDYLDREVQLRSQAGQQAKVRAAVRQVDATWRGLRPELVKAGGLKVAQSYDTHVRALKHGAAPAAVQKEAVRGLDIVDLMEGVFLGK